MAGTLRARVKGGMFEPLETLDLPVAQRFIPTNQFCEGKEVTPTLRDVPSCRDVEAFQRAAGEWKGLIGIDELITNIYADRPISTRPAPHETLASPHVLPHHEGSAGAYRSPL